MKHMLAAVIVALIFFVGSGCDIVPRTLTLGDGSTITHPFHPAHHVPMPVDNDIFRVIGAGAAVGPGKDSDKRPHAWWGFLFEMKTSVNELAITDVTSKNFALLTRQQKPKFQEGRWSYNTDPVLVGPQTTPWLYEKGDTLKIFRIDIIDLNGKTQTFYQPSLVPEGAKIDMHQVIKNIERQAGQPQK